MGWEILGYEGFPVLYAETLKVKNVFDYRIAIGLAFLGIGLAWIVLSPSEEPKVGTSTPSSPRGPANLQPRHETSESQPREATPNDTALGSHLEADREIAQPSEKERSGSSSPREEVALNVVVVGVLDGHPSGESVERPIDGAIISLRPMGGGPLETATSDSRGMAHLNVPRASYSLEVSAEGWATAWTTLSTWWGIAQHKASLHRGGTFQGQVLDTKNSPLANVSVTIDVPGSDGFRFPPQNTDSLGRFQFTGVTTLWPLEARFTKEGFASLSEGPFRVPPLGVLNRTFVLRYGPRASGRLQWNDGRPIPQASVILTSLNPRLNEVEHATTTDDEGLFHFEDLPLGDWAIHSRLEHHPKIRHQSIALEPDTKVENLVLVRDPGLSITGQLRLAQSSVPKGGVASDYHYAYGLTLRDVQNQTFETTSTKQGEFEFHGLHPGNYTLSFSESEQTVYAPPLHVEAKERGIVFEYEVASASLEFKVLGEDSSISGNVDISIHDPGQREVGDGHWLFDQRIYTTLPARCPLSIMITEKGYRAYVVENLELEVGQRRLIETQLSPIKPLQGTVVSFDGNPVPGAMVSVLFPDVPNQTYGFTRTDDTGSFEIYTPGIECFLLVKDAKMPSGMTKRLPSGLEDSLTLSLPRGSRISGSVLDPEGGPRSNLSVHGSLAHSSLEIFRIKTRADGSFESPLIAPGKLELSITSPYDHRVVYRESITVEDGVSLTLSAPIVIY